MICCCERYERQESRFEITKRAAITLALSAIFLSGILIGSVYFRKEIGMNFRAKIALATGVPSLTLALIALNLWASRKAAAPEEDKKKTHPLLCRKGIDSALDATSFAGIAIKVDDKNITYQTFGTAPLTVEPHPTDCKLCSSNQLIKDMGEHQLLKSLSGRPLIIPKVVDGKVAVTYFDLTVDERNQLFDRVDEAIRQLSNSYPTKKFGLSFHCGSRAGQTQWHVHARIDCIGSDSFWTSDGANWADIFR